VLEKKARLATDAWGHVDDQIQDVMAPIVARFSREFPEHDNPAWWLNRLVRHILLAEPMVAEYAECFRGMSRADIDSLMSSFELASCLRRQRLGDTMRAAIAADTGQPAAPQTH
jgi:hypothetical protein